MALVQSLTAWVSKLYLYVKRCLVSYLWRPGIVDITTAQLHSTKSELKFCAGSNSAGSVSEIRDGKNLWQWSLLEIGINFFRWLTIPQKQFILLLLIIKCYLKGAFLLLCYFSLFFVVKTFCKAKCKQQTVWHEKEIHEVRNSAQQSYANLAYSAINF